MKSNETEEVTKSRKKTITGIVIGLVIIGVGLAAAVILIKTKPMAKQRSAERMTPVVEATDLTTTNAQVIIQAVGVVIPITEVTVQAQVSGQVTAVHPEFIEGGRVKKDDVLVCIDDRDYLLAVRQKEAMLESAISDMKLEEGRQDVAKREWEMLGNGDGDGKDMALAMREPQMKSRQAAISAAEVELEKSKLSLERTKIIAPENAVVITADADVGDQATLTMTLGRLVGTDAYWIRVSLAVDEVKWLEIPGSEAEVILPTGDTRKGTVVRLLGDLEPQGRMARVLIEVKDPLGSTPDKKTKAPLIIGEFVRVLIKGTEVEKIYVLPRTALRDGSELWLLNSENHLRITPIDILWGDRDRIFVRQTWQEDLRLVTSDLGTPVEDMSLRLVSELNQVEPESGKTEKR